MDRAKYPPLQCPRRDSTGWHRTIRAYYLRSSIRALRKRRGLSLPPFLHLARGRGPAGHLAGGLCWWPASWVNLQEPVRSAWLAQCRELPVAPAKRCCFPGSAHIAGSVSPRTEPGLAGKPGRVSCFRLVLWGGKASSSWKPISLLTVVS